MQERSYTLPTCSVGRTTHVPSSLVNVEIDEHPSLPIMSNVIESNTESSTSTPELNLLLDKLTEILRFHSSYCRQYDTNQQRKGTLTPSSITTLKRLQSSHVEPLHHAIDASSITFNGSSASAGAWKPTNIHDKSSISNRSLHYQQHQHYPPAHHHNRCHVNLSTSLNNFERRRRLPCLLQRLINEGNLIKEAVRRLKTQRYSHTLKLQDKQNLIHTSSTPKTETSDLVSQLKSASSSSSSSSSSINITLSQQMNDSSSKVQATPSPNHSLSWFLSSSVFGVNVSTTNHNSGHGSPHRSCYSSSTHDRTPMEISVHDV